MTTEFERVLAQARSDDFEFMVLCHAKGNPAMYELLRDRSLDKSPEPPYEQNDQP